MSHANLIYGPAAYVTHSLHICATEDDVTFAPGDDVIHVSWHSCPEVIAAWIVPIWLLGLLLTILGFVEPPKLPAAEQVGFAVVGPDKGCIHPVHHGTTLGPHVPIREGPRITAHGHCVFEDPVLRA